MIHRTIAFVLVVVVFAPGVSARQLHVPDRFLTIEDAIDASVDGDSVIVADGIYAENVQFEGHSITLGSEFLLDGRAGHIAATVIDGGGAGTVVSSDQGEEVHIGGLTLRNGESVDGGGVYCAGGGVAVLSDLWIEGCEASHYGGGVYAEYTDLTVRHSMITGNTGGPRAGGIHIGVRCIGSVEGSVIEGNVADGSPAYGHGGGLSIKDAEEATVRHTIIRDNYAYVAAGGFWCNVPTTVENCIFVGNEADKNNGAGIVLFYPVVIENCTITGNRIIGNGLGGGIFASREVPVIRNSIIWGNEAGAGDDVWGECDITYSNVGGGWPGDGNIDTDPLMGSYRGLEYLLGPSSPCIDAGDPDRVDGIDDSHPRVPLWYVDGPRCDMGAYGGPLNGGWRP